MLLWEKKIPAYLTDRKNVVSFILFTAAFALVFINIYSPFGVDKWLDVSDFQLFFYSSVVILIGMLVIVISRLLMNLLTRNFSIHYGAYALWIIGEIFSLALVYALIQYLFLHVNNDFMVILKNSVRVTAFIILLPYVFFWLYLSFKDKYLTLEKITEGIETASDNPPLRKSLSAQLVSFSDEKGELRFSIKKEDLLYIEAADNYILIHYLSHNRLSKYMVRNTLKRIESMFQDAGLVRCHRSYVVNMDNVKFIRKERDGLILGFETPAQLTLPISKTYLEVFIRRMSHLSEPNTHD